MTTPLSAPGGSAGLDPGKPYLVNPAAKVIDMLVNPPRVTDVDRLHDAVTGRTVLVTGASFGIGEATARKLADAGALPARIARTRREFP